jgi:uncharacterized protein (DUF2249 family)
MTSLGVYGAPLSLSLSFSSREEGWGVVYDKTGSYIWRKKKRKAKADG